jgi:hypothetical protein
MSHSLCLTDSGIGSVRLTRPHCKHMRCRVTNCIQDAPLIGWGNCQRSNAEIGSSQRQEPAAKARLIAHRSRMGAAFPELDHPITDLPQSYRSKANRRTRVTPHR